MATRLTKSVYRFLTLNKQFFPELRLTPQYVVQTGEGGEDFPPRKKEKSGLGYAADAKIQLEIWKSKIYVRYMLSGEGNETRAPNDGFLKYTENTFVAIHNVLLAL